MDAQSKSALKTAILGSSRLAREFPSQFQENYLVWTRQENSWHGAFELRPNIGRGLASAYHQFEELGSDFSEVFFKAYPEYAHGVVGFAGIGGQNFGHDRGFLLKTTLEELWQRYHTFDLDEAAIDRIVSDFSRFADEPTVRLRFQAELLNFRMSESALPLAEGLTIRRLTDEEVSTFSGGPMSMLGFHRPRTGAIHEFVIEGDYEQEKWFGDQPIPDRTRLDEIKALLDRAILALRTFKEGRVGYDWVRQKSLSHCPIGLGSFGFSDLHVPAGSYEISKSEIEPLIAHAARIFSITESSMETACRRLADAEIRNRAEDQIIDAVIGMEALLLAALGKEDRRSELKYRFSINYSTLFESPVERRQAFKVAKDLYDLRSTLAHGGELGQPPYRVGKERMALIEAAKKAREALRKIITRFLSLPEKPIYRNSDFWESAYFGEEDRGQI
jgi:hypothetical protein